MDGIVNVLKPPKMSSHDVVSFIRKIFNIKKVGHTGTLDPMAAGVLPICLGKATKISQYLLDDVKRYRCEMVLGSNTDTQDRWGTVIQSRPVRVRESDIVEVFHRFQGEILQIPPMYSALKHKGKKLYELAREGKNVEREARKVWIYGLNIIHIDHDRILFDVLCSKGTYVRTLCEDIGNQLNCGAYMSFLIRTASGRFTLEEAVTLETLQSIAPDMLQSRYLYGMDYPFIHMPRIDIKKSSMKYVLNGNDIYEKNIIDGHGLKEGVMVRLYGDHRFVALGRVKKDKELYIDIERVF
ncbi:tRNA pseudouridine(55) synthase TruB [Thermotalea metallivorans]|uniref:tRNA pseudouridine synthase B n=1 Tax=Thermotalea metallivorans TaxID=520762 RepID=A0A140L5H3_9FIRM|nr:tRNA pseudouridine(55) synthase TruB [Thermotalea metallivorans]KXG75798.1 tRNA pseudouridine synthase B [Thermotalea metallivorans]